MTLTGLGDRAHLARSDVNLDTHITDVLMTLRYEDLSDVVLVGQSYGGAVSAVDPQCWGPERELSGR